MVLLSKLRPRLRAVGADDCYWEVRRKDLLDARNVAAGEDGHLGVADGCEAADGGLCIWVHAHRVRVRVQLCEGAVEIQANKEPHRISLIVSPDSATRIISKSAGWETWKDVFSVRR